MRGRERMIEEKRKRKRTEEEKIRTEEYSI
jgi:hypothetical protein